jgi:type I restriction enzyme R subunit
VGFFQAVRAAMAKKGSRRRRRQEVPTRRSMHAIRQIISRAVASDEVVDIFAAAGLKKPDISILSEEFLAEVRGMPQKNLAVELLRKLLERRNQVRAAEDSSFSRSHLPRCWKQSIRKLPEPRHRRPPQVIEELISSRRNMREATSAGKKLGLTLKTKIAFYDALEVNDSAVQVLGDDDAWDSSHRSCCARYAPTSGSTGRCVRMCGRRCG